MMNATEACKMAKENANKKMEKAITKAIEEGKTRATIEEVLSEDFAKELSEKGFDVMVFNNPGWTTSSTVDFSDKCSGKIKFTTDPETAGRTGRGMCF